jgi:hypothetical protein
MPIAIDPAHRPSRSARPGYSKRGSKSRCSAKLRFESPVSSQPHNPRRPSRSDGKTAAGFLFRAQKASDRARKRGDGAADRFDMARNCIYDFISK